MSKKELKTEKLLFKFSMILFTLFLLGLTFFIYLFLRPIILEEYCMPRAQEAAKSYGVDLLKAPPQDLLEEYKDRPDLINKDSQPSPYFVELLRCETKLSHKLYPFLR